MDRYINILLNLALIQTGIGRHDPGVKILSYNYAITGWTDAMLISFVINGLQRIKFCRKSAIRPLVVALRLHFIFMMAG